MPPLDFSPKGEEPANTAEPEDMVEVLPTVMEELGVSQDELKKMLEEEEERLKEENLRKKLELQCLEEGLQQKTYMVELHENALKALEKYKVVWNNSDMECPEIDSEEEDPSKSTEVIEPLDEDDDVMSLDSADISRMAKDQPLLHEAFLDLRKSAQDYQNFMDTVEKKSGGLDSWGASAAMAESEDTMKQKMEETTIGLDNLKQVIDKQLEELEYVWKLQCLEAELAELTSKKELLENMV